MSDCLTRKQLHALIGLSVKIKPGKMAGRSKEKGGHTIAKLVSIEGNKVIAVPKGHKGEVILKPDDIRFWRKGASLSSKYDRIKHLFEDTEDKEQEKQDDILLAVIISDDRHNWAYCGGKNFTTDINKIRSYDSNTNANRAASHVRRRSYLIGKVSIVSLKEAEELIRLSPGKGQPFAQYEEEEQQDKSVEVSVVAQSQPEPPKLENKQIDHDEYIMDEIGDMHTLRLQLRSEIKELEKQLEHKQAQLNKVNNDIISSHELFMK